MSVRTSHELKQLQSMLAKKQAEHSAAKAESISAQRRVSALEREVLSLQSKIDSISSKKEVVISEHALLRYFERVLGYDLDAIRRGLLTDDVVTLINEFKSGKIPAAGCRLIVQDRTVVSLDGAE